MSDNKAMHDIAVALAEHYDSLYYIDIDTGHYIEYVHTDIFDKYNIPMEGDDFFADSKKNASICVHPDDVERVKRICDKDEMIKHLSKSDSYTAIYRLVRGGRIEHVRHIQLLCEDGEHIICCLENIEDEIREKEIQKRNLRSAKRMARLDELTGIKNKNAYLELAAKLDARITSNDEVEPFAIVMCDVNDLKKINDTRGHSFGDEVIQRASRMICSVFKHSPVYRVGGDEFVVLLKGEDYDNSASLVDLLKRESLDNKRSRSGAVVACGLAEYDSKVDKSIDSVYERADSYMYECKKEMKSDIIKDSFVRMDQIEKQITDERKRHLDGMFGALVTVSGGGYVFLNDMKYDFSRWSLSLIDDFGLDSEYMYHADRVWLDYIHPDDLEVYREAIDAVLCDEAELRHIYYRARRADGTYVMLTTRGFVLSDNEGNPEYFGGIIVPQ